MVLCISNLRHEIILTYISNISFISKRIERYAVNHFSVLSENIFHLLPVHQFAYRQSHSTETAATVVCNDIVRATDAGQVSMLLDLSAAFDTVDHRILMDVLSSRFGANIHVLEWFHSYLSGRRQIVITPTDISNAAALIHGVPQGQVTYTEDVEDLIETFSVKNHIYADRTQLLVRM